MCQFCQSSYSVKFYFSTVHQQHTIKVLGVLSQKVQQFLVGHLQATGKQTAKLLTQDYMYSLGKIQFRYRVIQLIQVHIGTQAVTASRYTSAASDLLGMLDSCIVCHHKFAAGLP